MAEIFLYHLWKHERNAVPTTERIVDVLCPIFRVDLNLNRAQDGTSAKTGATAIENDGCIYGHDVLTQPPTTDQDTWLGLPLAAWRDTSSATGTGLR